MALPFTPLRMGLSRFDVYRSRSLAPTSKGFLVGFCPPTESPQLPDAARPATGEVPLPLAPFPGPVLLALFSWDARRLPAFGLDVRRMVALNVPTRLASPAREQLACELSPAVAPAITSTSSEADGVAVTTTSFTKCVTDAGTRQVCKREPPPANGREVEPEWQCPLIRDMATPRHTAESYL